MNWEWIVGLDMEKLKILIREREHEIAQLVRYGFVGVVVNAIAYVAYLLFTLFGLSPRLAMTILYVVGFSLGFIGHKRVTFSHEGGWRRSAARYFVAHVIGYSINWLLLWYFSEKLGMPHQAVQAVAILVVAIFLFLSFRIFVFAPAESSR